MTAEPAARAGGARPAARGAAEVLAAAVVTAAGCRWDEPPGCTSPRGWLHAPGGIVTGFYLDYGPDHYRYGHATEIYPGTTVSYCQPGRQCRDCQPGNILAVRYPGGPASEPRESRYAETIEAARRWVETGEADEPAG